MAKDNIQENLIQTGRQIIEEKGVEFLTARKLSEASGYSVGTIYNQFTNMDNFILIQNYLTLDALYQRLNEVKADFAYDRLNAYISVFTEFVMNNQNFWFMVYKFHLNQSERSFSITYLRRISKTVMLQSVTSRTSISWATTLISRPITTRFATSARKLSRSWPSSCRARSPRNTPPPRTPPRPAAKCEAT